MLTGSETETKTSCLIEKAVIAISSGRLPYTSNLRVWGGRGSGKPCDLCAQPVDSSESEIELDGADGGARFHVRCHSAWLHACLLWTDANRLRRANLTTWTKEPEPA